MENMRCWGLGLLLLLLLSLDLMLSQEEAPAAVLPLFLRTSGGLCFRRLLGCFRAAASGDIAAGLQAGSGSIAAARPPPLAWPHTPVSGGAGCSLGGNFFGGTGGSWPGGLEAMSPPHHVRRAACSEDHRTVQ